MKKKTFLSKFAARFMAATLMVSSVAMTGCYKDDGLDVTFTGGSVVVPDATYAISGTVSDYETGAAVNLTEVITSVGTAKVDGNGAFHVALTKADVPENGVTVNLTFKAEGYNDVQRSVFVKHIADGSSVVYPLSVTVKKAAEVVEYVDVVYNLKFIVKNAETGEAISNITPVVEGTADANGNYAAGEYVVTTPAVEGQYYASATAISLPEAQVVKGENEVRTNIIELYVQPVNGTVEPEKEYINISGTVVDKNGNAVVADEIVLDGTDLKVSNASEFRFTVLKADKNYTVTATKGGESVKSTSINANGGNYNCVLVFSNIGEDEKVQLPYVLTVNVIDAETKSPVNDAAWTINGEAPKAEYQAGNYTIVTTAAGYNTSSVLVTLNPVYGQAGEKAYHGVTVEMTKVAQPETEYVKVYGTIIDNRGKLAEAQIVKLEGAQIEPMYKTSTFSFNVKKDASVKSYKVVAEIMNANETGTLKAAAKVQANGAAAYYLTIQFPVQVENGKEVIGEGGSSTGTLVPEVDENGTVQETVTNIMSDGTTIVLEKGTVTNLGGQTLTLVRNLSEETNPSDASVVIRSYIGLPDGTTFSSPLKVMFADAYAGQLGDKFVLQYQQADNSWATDTEGGNVTFANNVYTMNIRHFSTFRAALNLNATSTADMLSVTESETVNEMNDDEAAKTYSYVYNGFAGTKFSDYAKLESDVRAAFTNANAQAVVLNAIKAICPDAKEEFVATEYTKNITIPGWTLLNTVDVTTKTVKTTYSITLNNQTITFSVKKIESVSLSATDKNMTHMGHSHGHGHGHGDNNNAGGGIIVNE